MLRVLVLAFACASFFARAQNAPSAPFSLSWEAPSQCMAAPETRALFGDAKGAAKVVIKPVDSRWHLSVTFIAPMNGERTVDTETCAEATEAALLLLQLGARGQLAMQPEKPRVPVVGVEVAAASTAPVRDLRDLSVSVSAMTGIHAFATPLVSAQFGAQLWVGRDLWAAMLSVTTGRPSRFVAPESTLAVDVYPLLDAVASGCLADNDGVLKVAACVDVEVAWWRLQGVFPGGRTAFAPFVALGPALRVQVPVTKHFAVVAGFAGRPSIVKPRVTSGSLGAFWDAGPVVLQIDAGLGGAW